MRSLVLLTLLAALSGCGQTGNLYLAEEAPAADTTAVESTTDIPADNTARD